MEAGHEGSNHAATLSVMAHKLILCTEPRVLAVQCAMHICGYLTRERKIPPPSGHPPASLPRVIEPVSITIADSRLIAYG